MSDQEPADSGVKQKPAEAKPKQSGVKEFAKMLNAKLAVFVIIALVVGIGLGQLALPTLGIGLVGLPATGGNTAVVNAELQAKWDAYLNKNYLVPQGVEGKIVSIEPYDNDFFKVKMDILKDGDSVGVQEFYMTKSGKALSGSIIFLGENVEAPAAPADTGDTGTAEPANIGTFQTFTDSGYQAELQGGKPVIRLFSTTWCPHCKWIKETFDKVAKEYVAAGKIVAYHWELDTKDDTLTEAVEGSVPDSENAVYKKFNPTGSIPTFVMGGRYYRVGNGFEATGDLAAEEAAFRAVIEELLTQAKQ